MKGLFPAAIVIAIALFAFPILTGGSETQMVNLSYLAVPLLIFGITGIIKKNLKGAVIAGVVGMVLLFVFFQLIWPSL